MLQKQQLAKRVNPTMTCLVSNGGIEETVCVSWSCWLAHHCVSLTVLFSFRLCVWDAPVVRTLAARELTGKEAKKAAEKLRKKQEKEEMRKVGRGICLHTYTLCSFKSKTNSANTTAGVLL